MTDDEIISAEIFQTYLQKCHQNVKYQKGADPPDFIFEIDNEKWAVEHTRFYQYIDTNKNVYSQEYIRTKQQEYEDSINSKIKSELELSYVISIKFSITNKEWEKFEEKVFELIDNNQNLDNFNYLKGKIIINRIDKGDKLFYCNPSYLHKSPLSNDLSCNIQSQINFTLEKIIKIKDEKLKDIKKYNKIILLIQNMYLFTNPQNVKKGIINLSYEIDCIDKIYIIIDNKVHNILE